MVLEKRDACMTSDLGNHGRGVWRTVQNWVVFWIGNDMRVVGFIVVIRGAYFLALVSPGSSVILEIWITFLTVYALYYMLFNILVYHRFDDIPWVMFMGIPNELQNILFFCSIFLYLVFLNSWIHLGGRWGKQNFERKWCLLGLFFSVFFRLPGHSSFIVVLFVVSFLRSSGQC